MKIKLNFQPYQPRPSTLRGVPRNIRAVAKYTFTPGGRAKILRGHARYLERYRALQRGEAVMSASKRQEIKKRKKQRERKDIALEAHELQELCRKSMASGVDRLKKILESDLSQDSVAIAAFTALADRGYGKASQTTISARVTSDGVKTLDQKTLNERIGETLRRVEELTGGKPKKAPRPQQPIDIRKYN